MESTQTNQPTQPDQLVTEPPSEPLAESSIPPQQSKGIVKKILKVGLILLLIVVAIGIFVVYSIIKFFSSAERTSSPANQVAVIASPIAAPTSTASSSSEIDELKTNWSKYEMIINNYMSLLKSGQADVAYDQSASILKANNTLDQFRSFASGNDLITQSGNFTLEHAQFVDVNADDQKDLEVSGNTGKVGDFTLVVTARLVNEDGTYKVSYLNFDRTQTLKIK